MARLSFPKFLAMYPGARGSLVVFEGVGIVSGLVSNGLVAGGLD